MTAEKILYIAKNRKIALLLNGLLFGAFSFAFLVFTQQNFKAGSDILIAQNQTGYADYYALSKSADYLSGVLTESIYSEKFLDEVIATKMMNPDFLPQDKVKRLRVWSDTIRIRKNPEVGIIHLDVFGDTQKQSVDVSNAVLATLANKSSLFLGQGQSVDIKILSGPIWQKNPTISNFIFAGAGGFVVGLILIFIWLYYSEEMAAKESYGGARPAEKDEYEESLEYLQRQ